jgi:hypothetical protein
VVELLATVENQHARAVGEWTTSNVAAHMREVTVLNSLFALGTRPSSEWRDVFDTATNTTMDGVAALNALALKVIGDRSPQELAPLINDQVSELLAGTADADGGEQIAWLGGTKVPLRAVLGHTLSELFLHGRDIAAAEGRSFSLSPPESMVIFDAFVFELLRSPDLPRFAGTRSEEVKPVTCELRLRGADPVLLVAEDGRLNVEPPGERRVDVRISADPATMWLVMSGRLAPPRPLMTGRLVVWGRRPWRLPRLGGALRAA